MTQPASVPRSLHPGSTAVLVIHGIGEQNPYETLDSFARGIFSFLKSPSPNGPGLDPRLSPLKIAHKDWTQVGIRIEVTPAAGKTTTDTIDLFEYYWAPYTEDKLSARNTITWLIRTDLSPLRYFASNLQAMQAAGTKMSWSRACLLFLREIARIALIYIPLAVALGLLLAWLPDRRSLSTFWSGAKDFLNQPPFLAAPAIFLFDVLGLFMLLFFAGSLLAGLRRGQTVQKHARRAWLLMAPLAAAIFLGIAWGISAATGISQQDVWNFFTARATLKPLFGAFLVWLISQVMTGYVADVAVYVNADAKSKNYEARKQVLDGAVSTLSDLLANPRYDRVIFAGHSLGSVIAYDAVNELLIRASAHAACPDLKKLRGLLTFGSPLDKIYYFFREHVKGDQAIRAQILSMLYGFRKVRSGRDYSPFEFHYHTDDLPDLTWLNAWSLADPVSGKLNFYDLRGDGNQESFRYWIPGYAHLSYWADPRFYNFWCKRLLLA